MARSTVIPEAHLLLLRESDVLLLRRQNTGYEDGNYSVIAGHIETGETPRQGVAREASEEAGLTIDLQDLTFCHFMHRKCNEERVSFFFTARRWLGEPRNLEPNKCSGLSWFPVNKLPNNVIPYIKHAIEAMLRGEVYSERGAI
ncbi:MAG: NUDIX domain-containing protein [Verrucomicrobiota bacterium]|nr:NUDIX domain-containing protein [Verrucomicrobiota bacterium]